MEVLFCNVVAISTCKSCVRSLSQRGTSCCDDAVVVHVFRGFLPALRRGKCNAMFCDMYVLLQLMKFYSCRVANNCPFFLPFQEKSYIALYVFLMCCSVRCGVSEALLHAVFKKHLNRTCNPVVASEQLCNYTCTGIMKCYELLVVMHEPVVIRCTPTTLKSCNSPKLHVIINSSVVFTSFSH